MGLSVVLETETGQPLDRLDDEKNVLHKILPSYDDTTYQLLRFVDWYGNTVFNRLQMEIFLDDLDKLERAVKTAEEVRLVRHIKDFARRSKEEPHVYLKFYGD